MAARGTVQAGTLRGERSKAMATLKAKTRRKRRRIRAKRLRHGKRLKIEWKVS
jgi:hypothetical protein